MRQRWPLETIHSRTECCCHQSLLVPSMAGWRSNTFWRNGWGMAGMLYLGGHRLTSHPVPSSTDVAICAETGPLTTAAQPKSASLISGTSNCRKKSFTSAKEEWLDCLLIQGIGDAIQKKILWFDLRCVFGTDRPVQALCNVSLSAEWM